MEIYLCVFIDAIIHNKTFQSDDFYWNNDSVASYVFYICIYELHLQTRFSSGIKQRVFTCIYACTIGEKESENNP